MQFESPMIKPIEWTDVLEPNESVRYHHVYGYTPIGRFLITWKGWKDEDYPVIDQIPWTHIPEHQWSWDYSTLDGAKLAAERAYIDRIRSCLDEQSPVN